MEAFAENRFTITKSLFYEGMRRVSKDRYGKAAKLAVAALAVAWLVLAGTAVIQGGSPVHVAVELAVVVLAALWICKFVPWNKARRAYKQLESKSGGDLDRVTRFYGDHLEVDAWGTKTTVLYSEVDEILYAKHLMLLVTKKGVGILLKLDGFIQGSPAEVETHIKTVEVEEHD